MQSLDISSSSWRPRERNQMKGNRSTKNYLAKFLEQTHMSSSRGLSSLATMEAASFAGRPTGAGTGAGAAFGVAETAAMKRVTA